MNELSEEELGGLEGQPDPLYSYAILRRAAAEIRRLRAALAERDAMLAKFGALASVGDQKPKDDAVYVGQSGVRITYGDLRRAASLASDIKEKQP